MVSSLKINVFQFFLSAELLHIFCVFEVTEIERTNLQLLIKTWVLNQWRRKLHLMETIGHLNVSVLIMMLITGWACTLFSNFSPFHSHAESFISFKFRKRLVNLSQTVTFANVKIFFIGFKFIVGCLWQAVQWSGN